ncbi:MAG TPA: non-heme iron oxygenase ferredoxin subunit [Alphaproteobacteria bacterium]|nr:non-heme iron oxygenase ferredoxin subunit [Alphaproteobacteria bacterium]
MDTLDIPFTPVARTEDIPPGSCMAFDINGRSVVIAHLPDGFHAVENRCSHAASALDCTRGVLRGGQILCPHHGARFDLKTGAAKAAPAFRPIAVYRVRVIGDRIEAAVPPRVVASLPPRPFGYSAG